MKSVLKVAGLAFLLAGWSGGADAEKAADVFPFVKGHYWLYDGVVTYSEGNDAKEKKITGWRSEVVDVVVAPDFKAALLKGHPRDLTWYDGDNERSDSIVLLTSGGEFHEISEEKEIVPTFQMLKAKRVLPDDLIGHQTIRFKFPPKTGDRFGDPEEAKLGPRYCWYIYEVATLVPDPAIKGVTSEPRFTIDYTFRTAPDHQDIRFVAGIGIVSYDYFHHGTPGNCEMKLVEMGEAAPKPAGNSR